MDTTRLYTTDHIPGDTRKVKSGGLACGDSKDTLQGAFKSLAEKAEDADAVVRVRVVTTASLPAIGAPQGSVWFQAYGTAITLTTGE